MKALKQILLVLFFINVALCSIAQKKKSAADSIKLKNAVSLEKNTRFATATFSFSTRGAKDYETLLTSVIVQQRHSFEVNAGGGYFFKKNLAAGMSGGYNEDKNEMLIQNADGTRTQSNAFESGFSLVPFLDYYIPIDNKQRFYLFCRTQLNYSHSTGVVENTTDNILTRTYTTTNGLGIGLQPGIMVFVVDRFAITTSVGILGFNYKNIKTQQTDKPDGKLNTTDFDLKIDILQLNLGFAVYF
jgi:hypothetical protein